MALATCVHVSPPAYCKASSLNIGGKARRPYGRVVSASLCETAERRGAFRDPRVAPVERGQYGVLGTRHKNGCRNVGNTRLPGDGQPYEWVQEAVESVVTEEHMNGNVPEVDRKAVSGGELVTKAYGVNEGYKKEHKGT